MRKSVAGKCNICGCSIRKVDLYKTAIEINKGPKKVLVCKKHNGALSIPHKNYDKIVSGLIDELKISLEMDEADIYEKSIIFRRAGL